MACQALAGTGQLSAVIRIGVSGVMIFVTLMGIVSVMRSAMKTRVEALVTKALGSSALVAIAVGWAVGSAVRAGSAVGFPCPSLARARAGVSTWAGEVAAAAAV